VLASLTKVEAAYQETRKRILTGSLPPGTALNQSELAAVFGVSPTPIREALRRLEGEGLVILMAHSTVIVAPLNLRELDELYAVRVELDSFAAGLATRMRTDDDVARMKQTLRHPSKGGATERLEHNRQFHRAVYSASGNQQLTALLDQLWDRTDRYRIILVTKETARGRTNGATTSDKEHRAIAAAVIERDAPQAEKLMRSHVQRSQDLIRDLLKGAPGGAVT
jgi:DNA-binding GntR family transcriptional regulator